MKFKRIVLFDFDGTLFRGDSTKEAFFLLFENWFSFILHYYLFNLKGIVILIFTGNALVLAECRRRVLLNNKQTLMLKFRYLDKANIFFESTLDVVKKYVKMDLRVVIISAGYFEVIEGYIADLFPATIIANSLLYPSKNSINYERKLEVLYERLGKDIEIMASYGNTEGDYAMLNAGQEAFLVDSFGQLSAYARGNV